MDEQELLDMFIQKRIVKDFFIKLTDYSYPNIGPSWPELMAKPCSGVQPLQGFFSLTSAESRF